MDTLIENPGNNPYNNLTMIIRSLLTRPNVMLRHAVYNGNGDSAFTVK